MYERYYGFVEKPFSLTPDPKYLYRSESHANAFDLLRYAVDRREGFVVITGDIGTGKTTLCRALLEEIDRTTFTALVLNPFLTEDDLLKRILLDFGVISRDDLKGGRLARVTKQELIETLYDFLLSLIPLRASAVLVIDEAQNLPLPVLEQIRILSNLDTDKEKLLQIILVGQLNLHALLRSPELRQLDQRVSIRYTLEPLDADGVAAYVAHRLAIAGGAASVRFTSKALKLLHRRSDGIPRLINLMCDRALLTAFSARSNRITDVMVAHAADSLAVDRPRERSVGLLTPRMSIVAASATVLLAATAAVGATAFLYQKFDARLSAMARAPERAAPQQSDLGRVESDGVATRDREGSRAYLSSVVAASRVFDHRLPSDTELTILVSSYPVADAATAREVDALTQWLELNGFAVFYTNVHLGPYGRWQRVLAGSYTDAMTARRDANRLRMAAPQWEPRVLSAAAATEPIPAAARNDDSGVVSGLQP
jgi:type II secretory pathway predicted ATPase ExeA